MQETGIKDFIEMQLLWSYQVHENDTFLVGCVGENRTENCPKVQGPDWDIPSSPILHALPNGSQQIIVGTKPGDILALDPERNGALLWRINVHGPVIGNRPLPAGMLRSGVQWGGAADDQNGYFGLTGGGMAAVRLDTGERRWYTPLNSTREQIINHGAAATVIPGVAFVGGSDGKLFAVSTADGRELWRFDTARAFDTVNKVPAKGGSIIARGRRSPAACCSSAPATRPLPGSLATFSLPSRPNENRAVFADHFGRRGCEIIDKASPTAGTRITTMRYCDVRRPQ